MVDSDSGRSLEGEDHLVAPSIAINGVDNGAVRAVTFVPYQHCEIPPRDGSPYGGCSHVALMSESAPRWLGWGLPEKAAGWQQSDAEQSRARDLLSPSQLDLPTFCEHILPPCSETGSQSRDYIPPPRIIFKIYL
jgi:hypothetical protein